MGEMHYNLTGRIVVVTGGGAGIGLGIVKVLAGQGARVVMAECNPAGRQVAESLRDADLDVRWVPCDVSDPLSIEDLFSLVSREYGGVDGLVNNAGLTIHEDFLEASLANLQRMINTNLRSVFLCTQQAARLMKDVGRGGAIVNLSSNHAGASMEGFEGYAATKGGICAMTRAMAWSLGQYGIRVNSLSPGLTSTDHISQLMQDRPQLQRFYPSLHATRRINAPEDVGQIAAFLISDASIGITGADLLADNGLSAHLFNRHED
ncbi:SDR family NAD(P)-dependent oxidoreductase [Cupriavidus sp. MP-37]|uniref:SDR family NAD(P)-dependent oxidoreductase n=1 Tax=Cupriavidus sp. MP-37 TaxID=2884455 RepID=UPI001D0A3A2C|nr:SDR family oxidoreductase [Cupriavidus sp. MP-37]UDM52718.1 SDR family oxidoreductase [Cupriavidus sp. MP-37]